MGKNNDPRDTKRWRYLRESGRPSLVRVGPETLRAHRKVNRFHREGMAYTDMARQTGLSVAAIHRIANSPDVGMQRSTLEKLGALVFEVMTPAPRGHGARLDRTPTARRLRAMWADGFPVSWLADRVSTQQRYVADVIHGRTAYSHHSFAERVGRIYATFEGVSPESCGIPQRSIALARLYASRAGCAPRHCWDPDTIADPDAFPEWTGACGTPKGYNLHTHHGIQPCTPCREAIAAHNRGKRSGS